MTALRRRATGAAAAGLVLALGLQACGETASTSGFSGEKRTVAQAIVNYQTDVTTREQKKLCQSDLAASVVRRLTAAGGCQAALKRQLAQVDAPGLTIEAISLNGKQALARVKSTYSGRSAISTLRLVREGASWKISALR